MKTKKRRKKYKKKKSYKKNIYKKKTLNKKKFKNIKCGGAPPILSHTKVIRNPVVLSRRRQVKPSAEVPPSEEVAQSREPVVNIGYDEHIAPSAEVPEYAKHLVNFVYDELPHQDDDDFLLLPSYLPELPELPEPQSYQVVTDPEYYRQYIEYFNYLKEVMKPTKSEIMNLINQKEDKLPSYQKVTKPEYYRQYREYFNYFKKVMELTKSEIMNLINEIEDKKKQIKENTRNIETNVLICNHGFEYESEDEDVDELERCMQKDNEDYKIKNKSLNREIEKIEENIEDKKNILRLIKRTLAEDYFYTDDWDEIDALLS